MKQYLLIKDSVIIEHERRQKGSIRASALKLNKPKSTIAYELKKVKRIKFNMIKTNKKDECCLMQIHLFY